MGDFHQLLDVLLKLGLAVDGIGDGLGPGDVILLQGFHEHVFLRLVAVNDLADLIQKDGRRLIHLLLVLVHLHDGQDSQQDADGDQKRCRQKDLIHFH